MAALLNCMFTPTFKPLNFDKKNVVEKSVFFKDKNLLIWQIFMDHWWPK